VDGTTYEFFRKDGTTRGVYLTDNQLPADSTRYDYTKLDDPCPSASSTKCRGPAEVAFVIDEQSSIDANGWIDHWIPHVRATIDGYQSGVTTNRFAFTWTKEPTFDPVQLLSDRTSLNNILDSATRDGGTTDFAASIIATINQHWPSGTTDAQLRKVVVYVGGADTPSSDQWAALATLRTQRNVDVWAIGIGAGASQTTLLSNIASSPSNIVTWNTAQQLSFDNDLMYLRLCRPVTNLCTDCAGFCCCVATDQCCCPACDQTQVCQVASCDDSTSETAKAGCFASNPYQCPRPGTLFDPACQDIGPCFDNGGSPSCPSPTIKDCNDTNICTFDYCGVGQGCQNVDLDIVQLASVCPNNDPCKEVSCDKTANSNQGGCVYTDILTPDCTGPNIPCTDNPCHADPDACTPVSCIQDTNRCDEAIGEESECAAAIAMPIGRYCYNGTLTCPQQTTDCQTAECDPNDFSTPCKVVPITCPDDGDPCTVDFCDPNRGGCVSDPYPCPQGSQCDVVSCTNVGGDPVCNVTGTVQCPSDGLVCTDDSVCTVLGGCTYPPIPCAATGGDCNVVSGCFETASGNNVVGCNQVELSALVDECGVCRGDSACLFPNDNTVEAGAVAGGVIAGLVLVAIAVIALLAFLSKKGYEHYKNKMDMNQVAMVNNATFVSNTTQGTMVDDL